MKKEKNEKAVFIGWQETSFGGHVALYNIEGGERHGSTVVAETLRKRGIAVPRAVLREGANA